MEQAVLEQIIIHLQEDNKMFKREIEELKKNQNDQRVTNERVDGKLDLILDGLKEVKTKVETVDNKSKLDWITIVTAVIVSALMTSATKIFSIFQ